MTEWNRNNQTSCAWWLMVNWKGSAMVSIKSAEGTEDCPLWTTPYAHTSHIIQKTIFYITSRFGNPSEYLTCVE